MRFHGEYFSKTMGDYWFKTYAKEDWQNGQRVAFLSTNFWHDGHFLRWPFERIAHRTPMGPRTNPTIKPKTAPIAPDFDPPIIAAMMAQIPQNIIKPLLISFSPIIVDGKRLIGNALRPG